MSDIFREVEEEVRREQYEQLWKKYGDYIIAAVALLVIGVAGFELWRYYDANQRARASDEYQAAQALLDRNKTVDAAAAFARLAKDAPGGYAEIAQLQAADALLAAGKTKEAVAVYKKIEGGSDDILGAVARIRIGWATVEDAPRLELETLLAPLTDPTSPWKSTAREILAYSDYHMGASKQALSTYESLANDKDAPIGVRQRADAMATFLKGGGDNDYGSLPKDAPPPAPAKH